MKVRDEGVWMKMSRRNFLSAATGAAAILWSFRPSGLDTLGSGSERDLDCVLVDLNSHCVLHESLQGYKAALADECDLLTAAELNSQCRCRIAIVPGLGPMGPAIAGTLCGLLDAGTHVLLESGAAFLSPAEFTTHQKMLQSFFDIEVGPPVDLWSGKSADDTFLSRRPGQHSRQKKRAPPESVPYVNYSWPRETEVRDFSRVIPVSARGGDVIGKVAALPVALKRHTAAGTLIFLGSPLGPALRAGDPEALSWLQLVTAL
jgi:hypothetical protein